MSKDLDDETRPAMHGVGSRAFPAEGTAKPWEGEGVWTSETVDSVFAGAAILMCELLWFAGFLFSHFFCCTRTFWMAT